MDETEIPKFVVNLSLPPQRRYDHVVASFREQIDMSALPGLFSDLLADLAGTRLGRCLEAVSKLTLRGVHGREETQELRGISRASGISMHILVAFNVLLDLLLGCTSGGARVLGDNGESHMLHFRTLDWGMDKLRNIVLQLDYVRGDGGPVVASSVTYLGYVGVLTGVRKGLSMSLNFRPHHCRDTWWHRATFRWHQLQVVLGLRPSISSTLRALLLDRAGQPYSDAHFESVLSAQLKSRSTSAYLTFCRPEHVYVVEKDHKHASIRDSDTFLTAYNHDERDEEEPSQLQAAAAANDATGMSDIVEFSMDRKKRVDGIWKQRVGACRKRHPLRGRGILERDVMKIVQDEEVSNDQTHYAVVMDPLAGEIIWARVYPMSDTSHFLY